MTGTTDPARSAPSRPKRLLLAPFEMKGALRASEVAACMQRILGTRPELVTRALPLGDGGPGTLDALLAGRSDFELRRVEVEDALGRPVSARFGLLRHGLEAARHTPTRAYIEAAEANGLFRLGASERRARLASSRGVGQLLLAALDAGATELWVGLGGSASTDGGFGALQTLGVSFLDQAGDTLSPGGGALLALRRVRFEGLDPRFSSVRIVLACDVMTPLLGPQGASHLFGPQKGASAEDVEALEAGLTRLASVLASGRAGVDASTPGAGAAGGLGFGLMAGLNATALPGLDVVADLTGLHTALETSDCVLTAEGCLDAQSLLGKGPVRLARLAAEKGRPTIAFVGREEVEAPMLRQVVLATAADPHDGVSATAALERALEAWHPPR